jgi:hypothetical protein
MLDKSKESNDCQWRIESTDRYSNSTKGKNMDIFVTAIVAIIVAILAVLIAVFIRKTIGKIFVYVILGLIIGLSVGYFLTPIIISFF